MKKKLEEISTYYPMDFDLFGIISPAKEYKLAWHLNQLQDFHLVKIDDIKIDFAKNKQIRVSSLAEVGKYRYIYLLKNKLIASNITSTQYLLPDLQQFDYLLKLSSETEENWAKELFLRLKDVAVIDYCVQLEVAKLKMKDNLVF